MNQNTRKTQRPKLSQTKSNVNQILRTATKRQGYCRIIRKTNCDTALKKKKKNEKLKLHSRIGTSIRENVTKILRQKMNLRGTKRMKEDTEGAKHQLLCSKNQLMEQEPKALRE